jgi:predicted DNA binding protein
VTPGQQNVLVAARERGYFDIPRETTLRELADELDVSHQTLSEHLRRGIMNLVDATLTTQEDAF